MRALFVPSWNADVRFLQDGDVVKVEIYKPTAAELDSLTQFLGVAREKKWTELEKLPELKGRVWKKASFTLKGNMAEIGDAYVKLVRPSKSAITAVKFSGGEVIVTEADQTKKIIETAKDAKDEKAVAVSVKRATPCCPQCVPGAIGPASEVLLSFLTPEQHRDWSRHRTIAVEGGLSGHRYLLAHRHSVYAQKWGRICFDSDDRGVVHFHDWSHPPEEEVLGAMLALQHREPWLRNEATCFTGGFRSVYKNPFGGVMDGVKDAALAQSFGAVSLVFAAQGGDETAQRAYTKLLTNELEQLDGTLGNALVNNPFES